MQINKKEGTKESSVYSREGRCQGSAMLFVIAAIGTHIPWTVTPPRIGRVDFFFLHRYSLLEYSYFAVLC